jgi:hypothetical protein
MAKENDESKVQWLRERIERRKAGPPNQLHGLHENEFIGPDWLLIRLGSTWSEENMRLASQRRRNN